MPTTLNSGLQLPDKGSVDWYGSMQTNYNLLDNHLENTDIHVTAEDKANWNSKQGSLSQAQLDAIAQVATNTNDIATLQSGKANASHTHSSSDITDIGDYATKTYVDNSISGLVDNAPAALDTLKELSTALNDDANFASTVATALGAKANSADLATVATSGSYNDLSNKPTINDSTITIQKNGTLVGTFTVNGSAKTIDIPVPTKTSDLTNDSNFVDTSNSAVASGITSAKVTSYDSHIADTDIHVTTTDKTKWNNGISQSYVLRYSSSSVTDNSTIAYSTIDNTDNIKSGDKILDVDGKLFEITAVDTTNQTVTVGTALIDLALDGNVVHTSGDETIGGNKTFSNRTIFSTTSVNGELTLRQNAYDPATNGQSALSSTCNFNINARSVTNGGFAGIGFYGAPGFTTTRLNCRYYTGANESEEIWVECTVSGTSGSITGRSFKPSNNGLVDLGTNANRWKSVYATNYYYGSSNVEFSTKFVTSDTNQTISGGKTFTDNVKVKNNDVIIGSTSGSGAKSVIFTDANDQELGGVTLTKISNGSTAIAFKVSTRDNTDALISSSFQFFITKNGNKVINPTTSEDIALGRNSNKWSDVVTTKVNGLTPSSLSLPDFSNRVDIVGYISNLSGNTNNYTPPVNGWLYVGSNDASYLALFDTGSGGCGIRFSDGVVGEKYAYIPCQANRTLGVKITCTNLAHAYFVPCLGNI